MREALQRVDTLYKGEDLTYSYIYSDILPISETIIKVGKFFDQQPYVVVNSTWEDRLIEVYKIEQNHTFRKKFSYIIQLASGKVQKIKKRANSSVWYCDTTLRRLVLPSTFTVGLR